MKETRNKSDLLPAEEEIIRNTILHYRISNAPIVGQLIVDSSKKFGKHTMQSVEKIFREINSPVHLISLPRSIPNEAFRLDLFSGFSMYTDLDNYTFYMPHDEDNEYQYWLWVEVNGQENADKVFEYLGISAEENFTNLANTGMLVPKKGVEKLFSEI